MGIHCKGSRYIKYKYSGSDNIDDVAWYRDYSSNKPHEVKGKNANSLGIYDMSGSVTEWCWDWYDSITSSNADTGASSGNNRVSLGGSWCSDAPFCAVNSRNNHPPVTRYRWLGFRVVRTANAGNLLSAKKKEKSKEL